MGMGTDSIGWSKVVSIDGIDATVKTCMEGNDVLVYSSTGKPVHGVQGRRGTAYGTVHMMYISQSWREDGQKWIARPPGTCAQ